MIHKVFAIRAIVGAALGVISAGAMAASCAGLPDWQALRTALRTATAAETSGLDLQMWATVVDRDGVVCAVAYSGTNRGAQWPGSRVISAQKANAANAFSLAATPSSTVFPAGLALSTANLFSAVQPGGNLFGLEVTNPVETAAAYGGNPELAGTLGDGMVGKRVGGVNVFGGGLALYDASRRVIGAVGVSGDTSCADHMIAWRVRNLVQLDYLATIGGVSGDAARPDNIIYDIVANPAGGVGVSAGGFGHPTCLNTGNQLALPAVR